MKTIGELLVESIKSDAELLVEYIKHGDTSTSCAFMKGIRTLCQFSIKLVKNNHIKSGDWVNDLKEITKPISAVIKEGFDDVDIAKEALNEIKDFINILEK